MALYQQGKQRIEIVIRAEGIGSMPSVNGNKTKDVEIPEESSSNTVKIMIFGSNNPARIRRVIKTNATHALAIAKQVTDLNIEYYVGGIGYANGDQAMQQQISRSIEIVKDTTNIASSIGMGALYGSWGGPIGAVLGATMGAVSSITSTAIKYSNREREKSVKVFKEENAISYRRARAQLNLTNGRLR